MLRWPRPSVQAITKRTGVKRPQILLVGFPHAHRPRGGLDGEARIHRLRRRAASGARVHREISRAVGRDFGCGDGGQEAGAAFVGDRRGGIRDEPSRVYRSRNTTGHQSERLRRPQRAGADVSIRRKGNVRALVFGCATHNTTLGGIRQISGDYAGFAQEYIEKQHPGVQAMFVTGCAASAQSVSSRQYGTGPATRCDVGQ